jgi:hypothetical protein
MRRILLIAAPLTIVASVAVAIFATANPSRVLPVSAVIAPGPHGGIVRQSGPPADWPAPGDPVSPLGARIGGQPGGQARGYWQVTVYQDGTVERKYIDFPFNWTP